MVNVGLVINEIFGQRYDRIGVGYTWSDPADQMLDDQSTIDAFYRVQVTPGIQFDPTFRIIFDPSRNLEEDTVYVWGIRARFALYNLSDNIDLLKNNTRCVRPNSLS